jgi:hypothetical protein
MDLRRAARGIFATNRDHVFVRVILVHVVEMAIVQIVDVAVMANRGVPAFQTMLMSVIGMMLLGTGRHDCVLSSSRICVPYCKKTFARA